MLALLGGRSAGNAHLQVGLIPDLVRKKPNICRRLLGLAALSTKLQKPADAGSFRAASRP